MSKLTRMATPLIAVMMLSSAPLIALAQNSQAANNTPSVTTDASVPATVQAQQGFRDGLEAAKLDKLANRTIDAKASHLYVHPPVKGNEAVDAYRSSFQTGYDAAVKHGVQVVRAIPTGGGM